jgi:hypothetical protein
LLTESRDTGRSATAELGPELRSLIRTQTTGLQDARLVALRRLGLRTARAILTARGEIDLSRAEGLVRDWSRWAPQWPELMDDLEDALRLMQIQLERLTREKPLRQLLMSCGKPIGQPESEQRIRLSCGLAPQAPVGDYETRLAVLSALLTPLRQSVGSCFATAACILVQREEPAMLLDDLRSLIELGKLERMVEGQSSTVPLAIRWAGGLVRRPIPERVSAPWKDPGFIRGACAAGLAEGPFAGLGLRRQLKALAERGVHLGSLSIEDLFGRLVAQALDLPWPVPSANAEGQDLLMGGAAVRLLRKRESWQERVRQAAEAFTAEEHHPLLKTWEYSVASFVEAKPLMAAHNLWTALGLSSEDSHSVGGALRGQLQPALDSIQQEIEQAVGLANQCVARVERVKSRSRHLRDARDAEWAQLEARGAQRDYDYAQGRLSQLEDHAEQIAGFPKLFAEVVQRLMPRYFQEAYDPALVGQTTSVFDDAPAGFRLVFKGGVDFVPSWKWIDGGQDYRLAVREFFDRCFLECRDDPQTRLIGPDVNRLAQSFSLILDQPAFQLGALQRLSEAHARPLPPDPLHHLDQVSYKPWAYESGGTLLGLVQHYFALPELPTSEQKNCERAIDLVAFLIDQIRLLPEHQAKLLQPPWGDLLAFSPTHAFTLLAGGPDLQRCLSTDLYAYTLLQQEWLDPQEAFWKSCILSAGPQLDRILESWISQLPETIQPVASLAAMGLPQHLPATELFELIRKGFPERLADRGRVELVLGRLEGTLLEQCPLVTAPQGRQALINCFPELPPAALEQACDLVDRGLEGALGRRMAVQIAALIAQSPIDTQQIVARLRAAGLMAPKACVWADTNWPFFQFSLAWSPREQAPSLWRTSPLADRGLPMVEWASYLDLGNEEPWGWLSRPTDYRSRLTSLWMVGHRGSLLS